MRLSFKYLLNFRGMSRNNKVGEEGDNRLLYTVIGTLEKKVDGTKAVPTDNLVRGFMTACDGKKVIVITGEKAHIGKSTVVEELANSLGESGLNVLVIDADIQKSTGIASKYDAMNQMVKTEHFDIVRCMNSMKHVWRPADRERLVELVNDARENYDIVLIDTPPICYGNSVKEISKLADGVVVVKLKEEKKEDMEIIGVIENAGLEATQRGPYPWTRQRQSESTQINR